MPIYEGYYTGSQLQVGLENRRGTIDRVENQGAEYFKVTGLIDVNGPGESIVDVAFPVLFTERPRFSFSGELASGQSFTLGSLPAHNVMVLQWDERARGDGTIVYVGAKFGILVAGVAAQQSIIQWHMEGIGLRGPTSG